MCVYCVCISEAKCTLFTAIWSQASCTYIHVVHVWCSIYHRSLYVFVLFPILKVNVPHAPTTCVGFYTDVIMKHRSCMCWVQRNQKRETVCYFSFEKFERKDKNSHFPIICIKSRKWIKVWICVQYRVLPMYGFSPLVFRLCTIHLSTSWSTEYTCSQILLKLSYWLSGAVFGPLSPSPVWSPTHIPRLPSPSQSDCDPIIH